MASLADESGGKIGAITRRKTSHPSGRRETDDVETVKVGLASSYCKAMRSHLLFLT
jgi:hypothetical protein